MGVKMGHKWVTTFDGEASWGTWPPKIGLGPHGKAPKDPLGPPQDPPWTPQDPPKTPFKPSQKPPRPPRNHPRPPGTPMDLPKEPWDLSGSMKRPPRHMQSKTARQVCRFNRKTGEGSIDPPI